MEPDFALRHIDATLTARGFTFVRPPLVYRGPIRVHGTEVLVEIDIVDASFSRLPSVRLTDDSGLQVGELAHLLTDSNICYQDGGLPLDLYNPGGSVLRVLAEAENALERSFGGQAPAEFERELASYWQGGRLCFAIQRGVAPTIIRGDVTSMPGSDNNGLVVVPTGAWPDVLVGSRNPATVLTSTTRLRHAIPFPPKSLSALLDYLSIQMDLPDGWRKVVIDAAAGGEYCFVSAPNAIIGWSPEFPTDLRVIRDATGVRPTFFRQQVDRHVAKIGIGRMTGTQVDLPFCVNRNLANRPSLVGKRVALVGCGTIGGYLARMLAQVGAGCGAPIVLYDTDTLSPGNLGRHALGFADLNRLKAVAVAEHLKDLHPDVEVEPRHADATAEWDALEAADIIIDATGEANVSALLNEKYLRSARTGQELALMHTFVFGNGVAAQSFLNLKDGLACHRCLKTAFDSQWRYDPRKDTSSELETVAATCGEGGYAPFSVDAPIAAAALSLRAALDWARGQPGPRLRTTIVDHVAGRDHVQWKSPASLSDCPACGTS